VPFSIAYTTGDTREAFGDNGSSKRGEEGANFARPEGGALSGVERGRWERDARQKEGNVPTKKGEKEGKSTSPPQVSGYGKKGKRFLPSGGGRVVGGSTWEKVGDPYIRGGRVERENPIRVSALSATERICSALLHHEKQ